MSTTTMVVVVVVCQQNIPYSVLPVVVAVDCLWTRAPLQSLMLPIQMVPYTLGLPRGLTALLVVQSLEIVYHSLMMTMRRMSRTPH